MIFFYNIFIKLYAFFALLLSPFNIKAKQWSKGRKTIKKDISKDDLQYMHNCIWFHSSSLGEFEQGRPLIETIKTEYPEKKILLTFFSPSGYEIRKNYEYADYICYLPNDTKKNALKFLNTFKPSIILFIKYDFWYHFINEAYNKNIPLYVFSSIFTKDMIFFKKTGKWFANILRKFDHIFVQNANSRELLKKIGINNTTIAGDTRIDRVAQIPQNAKKFPKIETFIQKQLVFICGSTWQEDEEYILKYLNENELNFKIIIAPHKISENNIKRISEKIKKNHILYSNFETYKNNSNILIIDNIGMLQSLYKYSDITYIGGGFGEGIHNTLEPATFGQAIIFGPKYHKYHEACTMVANKSAFVIKSYKDFEITLNLLLKDSKLRQHAGKLNKDFIQNNKGATRKILNHIKL